MSEALAPPGLGALLQGSRDAVLQPPEGLDSLVRRLQARDDRALEPFISATQSQTFRLAMSVLNDRDRCQDVLQDVYLIVYRKIDQLRDPAALRGWLAQIVINRCRQELRGKRLESLDELSDAQMPSQDGMADRVHNRVAVQEAMLQLGPHDRTVLTMREVLDLTYEDIAKSLEVPVGTVRSRLFKARARLLALLTPQDRRIC